MKPPKGLKSTNHNLWPGIILSSSTTGLMKAALLLLHPLSDAHTTMSHISKLIIFHTAGISIRLHGGKSCQCPFLHMIIPNYHSSYTTADVKRFTCSRWWKHSISFETSAASGPVEMFNHVSNVACKSHSWTVKHDKFIAAQAKTLQAGVDTLPVANTTKAVKQMHKNYWK